MAITINRRLNLVLPIERDGKTIYVHSIPISRDVYANYFTILAETVSEVFGRGFRAALAVRVAAMTLQKIATEQGIWEDSGSQVGVKSGLLNEIRRLTTVIQPGPRGWDNMLLDDALKAGVFDEDEAAEVDSVIVFFTASSWILRPKEFQEMFAEAGRPYGAFTTSSSATAFSAGLPTSSAPENTGARAIQSSLPS